MGRQAKHLSNRRGGGRWWVPAILEGKGAPALKCFWPAGRKKPSNDERTQRLRDAGPAGHAYTGNAVNKRGPGHWQISTLSHTRYAPCSAKPTPNECSQRPRPCQRPAHPSLSVISRFKLKTSTARLSVARPKGDIKKITPQNPCNSRGQCGPSRRRKTR